MFFNRSLYIAAVSALNPTCGFPRKALCFSDFASSGDSLSAWTPLHSFEPLLPGAPASALLAVPMVSCPTALSPAPPRPHRRELCPSVSLAGTRGGTWSVRPAIGGPAGGLGPADVGDGSPILGTPLFAVGRDHQRW